MLIDARRIPSEKEIKADLCIIGAGAAGISIARELARSNIKVALLESGGLEYDEATQALYEGKNVGQDYYTLESCRLRYFGGTTNHWVGACRPLDPFDFEPLDWVPNSGWPIKRQDLDPYYLRAHQVLSLGPYNYAPGPWASPGVAPLPMKSDRVISTVFQFNPVRFGTDFRAELERAANIEVYLHSNVVDFDTPRPVTHVKRVRVACLSGTRFWVSAKHFILATGGIENARVLLSANSVAANGLGNQQDLVGRYFMEHIHLHSGIFMPASMKLPGAFYDHRTVKGINVRGAIAIGADTLRREKLLPMGAYFASYSPPGLDSLQAITSAIGDGKWPSAFLYHLKQVITNIDELVSHSYQEMTSESELRMFMLLNRTAPVPNPDSRVTLANDKDALGIPKTKLNWQLTEFDRRSIRRGHEIIAEEMGRAGLGRFKIELPKEEGSWPENTTGGYHHMGTTRMHDNPNKGVVDRNCRVHGMANLFVAGSSVFPTVGYSNPTLTIVALALRLADHVKLALKRG